MNKIQLTIILQSCLLSFEGVNQEKILTFTPEHGDLVDISIKLNKFLQKRVNDI